MNENTSTRTFMHNRIARKVEMGERMEEEATPGSLLEQKERMRPSQPWATFLLNWPIYWRNSFCEDSSSIKFSYIKSRLWLPIISTVSSLWLPWGHVLILVQSGFCIVVIMYKMARSFCPNWSCSIRLNFSCIEVQTTRHNYDVEDCYQETQT